MAVSANGLLVASVGGTITNFWDLRKSGTSAAPLESVNTNQKTVTCARFNFSGDRLVTGALDHHLKVFRTDTFSVCHTSKFNAPIMAVDWTRSERAFCVGLSEGTVIVKMRGVAGDGTLGESEEENDDLD